MTSEAGGSLWKLPGYQHGAYLARRSTWIGNPKNTCVVVVSEF